MSDPLKRFELVRLLGRGGMGEVYLARRLADGVTAALKIARQQLGEQGRKRLEREAELLGRVASPNLPAFLEAFESRGRFVLAMEFVAGEPLQHFVEEPGEPSARLELVRRSLPGVACGLRELHQLGIVHRDVKPANVVLADERCVVVDLGLARGPDVETLTKTGLSVGTPEYLPPEQVSGDAVTPSADMYQVALIARDLLAGSRRRPGFDAVQDAIERAVRPAPDLREELPWVPAPLAEWIRKALHPDPAARPQTAAHLQALEDLVRELPAAPAIPATEPERPTWMETEDFAQVARLREEARRTGWSETALDPAPMARAKPGPPPATPASRRQAAATPAPPRQAGGSPLWAAMAGAVLGLGLALAVAYVPGDAAPIASGPWVLGLEGNRLVVLRGEGEYRVVAPLDRPLTRGPRGRLGVELATLATGEPVEVRLARGPDERTLRLPGRGTGLPRAALHGDELRLALPLVTAGPAEVLLRAAGELWGAEVDGPVVLSGRPSHLARPTWIGSIEVGPRAHLEFPVDLRAAMEARLAEARPPEVPLDRLRATRMGLEPNGFTHEPMYPSAALEWLLREGPEVRAALRAAGVSMDQRLRVYDALAPMVHLEWMWHDTAQIHGWAASRLLPPDMEVTAGNLPSWDPTEARMFQKLYNLSLRIGGTAAIKAATGTLERVGELDIRRDADGVAWFQLAGLPTGPVDRADLLLQAVGVEAWSRVEVHLGGRVLRIPLGQSRMWRTHGIPLEIFDAARLGDGAVEVGLRLDPDQALRIPDNGNLVSVGVRLLTPREAG